MDLRTFLTNSDPLAALVENLIRVGEVTSVDAAAATARVWFSDKDDVESFDLQVMTRNAGKTKRLSMPDIGEIVVCLFLPSGVETGFIVGSIYPANVARPTSAGGIDVVEYDDGARIEYDTSTGALAVSGVKSVSVAGSDSVILEVGGSKFTATPTALKLESNGSSLELDAAGWRLSGLKGDLN